ncbi:hypothetical protein [Marinobacter alkaliphilus]|uniref:Uncharacterized protein n=1 Tax=Marinobacter alkaliphilus TaxID=254719 RepID=A0ABZ3E7X0_9GAMM
MTFKVKLLIVGAVLGAVAMGSWTARGWFEDSKDLAAVEAQRALATEIREGQAAISKQVEERLSQLRANERIIDRGVIREIQKPIYQRVCFEPELVELLNAAQRGDAGARSAEPAGEVSRPASRVQ